MKESYRQHGFVANNFIVVVEVPPPTTSAFLSRLDQVKKDAESPTIRANYLSIIKNQDIRENTWINKVYGIIDGAHR